MHEEQREDTLIVGAGPIGIACGIAARRRGIDPLLVDSGAVVNSITKYPVQMRFFTTPELLEIGGHPFPCAGEKPTREEAIKYYRGVVRAEGLRVRTFSRLVGAAKRNGAFAAELETEYGGEMISCARIVLATGYFDHPNLLGVPGEELPHVSHYYDEGHASFEKHVVVVGGKNSAVEAALNLFRCGAHTTLVYRGHEFRPSVKYWMKPDIENRIAAGEITAYLGAEVLRIEARSVLIRTADGEETAIDADRVFALTGYHPDHDLFRRLGIELDGEEWRPRHDEGTLETNVPGIFVAGSITAGKHVSEIFIENGRFDGERIFGDGGNSP